LRINARTVAWGKPLSSSTKPLAACGGQAITISGVDNPAQHDMLCLSVPAVAIRRMKREAGEAAPSRIGHSGAAPQR